MLAEYAYNARGERIKKTVHEDGQTDTTYYLYEQQRLVAEANSQGEITRRYIYLDDKVVGVWQHDQFYAVHSDQRGAPEAISNIQGRTVWQAQMDPWGRAEIDADPDRDGQTFVFNLRLPGQIEDRETGTYYNYQRDYDPRTGRYLTPDPSGQAGGLNTYLYAKANPLRYSDPLGLAPISAEDLNGDVDSYNYSGPTPGSSCLESELYFGEAIAKLAEAYGGSEAGRILYSWPITDSISFIMERSSQQVSASSQHGVPLFNPSNPSHPVTGSLNGNQINVLGDQLAILPSYGQDQIVFAVRKGATEAQIYNDLRERLGNLVTEQDVRHLMESVYGGSDVADKDYVIDLFPLYEEITTRFQTRLQTQQSIIDAEYQVAEATAALRNYLAENRNEDCRTQGNNGDSAACENMRLHRRLNEELAGAYEQYQQTIQHEYQNLVGRGYLPQLAAYQDDIAARGDAWRQAGEFGIALAGIFIPMTLADLAIDLATAETVIGPIARRIERATEAVRIMFKGSDELAAANAQRLTNQTVEASKRIVAVRYPHLTELGLDNILENPTIARYLSQRSDWSDDLLRKLNDDLATEEATEFTVAINKNPVLLESWKELSDSPIEVRLNPVPNRLTSGLIDDAASIISSSTKGQLRKQAALSRAGVDELGIVSKNYTNLPGSVKNFPGVRRLDDDFFVIDDQAAYIKQVEKLYADSGNTLNSVTRARILEHVGDGTRQFPTQAGIPGLHAEVQSVNSVINQVPVGFDLSRINVSTIKLAPGPGQGLPFPACSNCGEIFSNSVNILTGVK